MDTEKLTTTPPKRTSSRRLFLFSLANLAIISAIILLGSILISVYHEVNLINDHLSALPDIINDRSTDLEEYYKATVQDNTTRGQLAVMLYGNYETLSPQERLDLIIDSVSAQNAALYDAEGNVITSTSSAALPKYPKSVQSLVINTPGTIIDVRTSDYAIEELANSDLEGKDADVPFFFAGSLSDGSTLVVEFDYSSISETIEGYGTWDSVLERTLSGMAGYAFVNIDDQYLGYPISTLSEEKQQSALDDCKNAIGNVDSFAHFYGEDDTGYGLAWFLGKPCLTAVTPPSSGGTIVVVAVPIVSFMLSTLLTDLVLIAFILCTLSLFDRYALKALKGKVSPDANKRERDSAARKDTSQGILVVLVTTATFFAMLLVLESMSTTAYTTDSEQQSIAFEATHAIEQEEKVVQAYSDRCITRSNAIAKLLTDHPELRTREDLQSIAPLWAPSTSCSSTSSATRSVPATPSRATPSAPPSQTRPRSGVPC